MASVWDWTQKLTWRYTGVEVNLQTFLTSTLDKVWLSTSCSSSMKSARSFHCLRSENIMQGTLAITLLSAPSNPQLKVTVHAHTCPLFYMTNHLCIIWECNSCPCSGVFCFNSKANFILLVKVLPLCIIFTVVLLRITVSRCSPVTTTDTGICHCWCLWLTNWLFCESAKWKTSSLLKTIHTTGVKQAGIMVMV